MPALSRGEQLLTRLSGLLLLARLQPKKCSLQNSKVFWLCCFLCYINHNLNLLRLNNRECACQPLCQHQQTISSFPWRVRHVDPQGSAILNLLRHAPSVAELKTQTTGTKYFVNTTDEAAVSADKPGDCKLVTTLRIYTFIKEMICSMQHNSVS